MKFQLIRNNKNKLIKSLTFFTYSFLNFALSKVETPNKKLAAAIKSYSQTKLKVLKKCLSY